MRRFAGTIRQPASNPLDSFIITVNVNAGETFTLPLIITGNYNFIADWGDGSSDQITAYDQLETDHTYSSAGSYDIDMNGIIEGWSFQERPTTRLKISLVKQWGTLKITSSGAFKDCSNLDVTAPDDLKNITTLSQAFSGCINLIGNSSFTNWDVSLCTDFNNAFESTKFNQPIGVWNMSSAVNLSAMFARSTFNQPIDSWNVSNVNDIRSMFLECSTFNQPLNSWVTTNVTLIANIFEKATLFNQNIGAWNVSSVTDMQRMFNGATNFNNGGSPDIGNWNVSNVSLFNNMFTDAISFNQPIGTWNTISATSLIAMFARAGFNQPIGTWNVSNVTNMTRVFLDNTVFNQNLGAWNVGSVTTFFAMFDGASAFNNGGSPDIANWVFPNVTTLQDMFWGSAFNQNIGAWNVSNVSDFRSVFRQCPFNNGGSPDIGNWNMSSATNLGSMFFGNSVFNQPVGTWNTINVSDTRNTFRDALAFDQDLGGWDVTSLTLAENMFLGAELSTINYDALLVGWEAQLVNNNVIFHAGTSTYTAGSAAATARQNLINDHSWSITDGGAV